MSKIKKEQLSWLDNQKNKKDYECYHITAHVIVRDKLRELDPEFIRSIDDKMLKDKLFRSAYL